MTSASHLGSPPTDTLLVRSVYRGRVLWAAPHLLVKDGPDRIAHAIVPGVRYKGPDLPRAELLPAAVGAGWPLSDLVWRTNNVLSLTPVGAAYSIDLFWNAESGVFRCWYFNLQAPLRRTALGFDTLDHVLDVVAYPDGTWRWKDEDELDDAVRLGVFTPAEAVEIREEGERVISNFGTLLPTGWEDWQPPSGLNLPELRPGWETLPT